MSIRSVACAIAVVLAACSLDVPLTPGLVDPTELAGGVGIKAIHDGPLVTFNSTVPYVATLFSGILTDEFRDATGQYASIDSRSGFTVGLNIPYARLQKVRYQLLDAIATLRGQQATKYPRAWLTELYSLAAYVEIILGEQICPGVPLSTIRADGSPSYGQSLTTEEVFRAALAKTDTALSFAGDSLRIDHLAGVVRGRALLALGRFADAAASVAVVPTAFVYQATFNAVNPNVLGGTSPGMPAFAVADTEGVVGLPFASANDPRVRSVNRGTSNVGPIGVFALLKYPSRTSPFPVADGIEARLIEVDPGSASARVDLVFRERAFWLYATGHRLGDLRRLVAMYSRDAREVFPRGSYFQSANGTYREYGNVMSIPIEPSAESANPRFRGCLEE